VQTKLGIELPSCFAKWLHEGISVENAKENPLIDTKWFNLHIQECVLKNRGKKHKIDVFEEMSTNFNIFRHCALWSVMFYFSNITCLRFTRLNYLCLVLNKFILFYINLYS
jgi:hypothetical protein